MVSMVSMVSHGISWYPWLPVAWPPSTCNIGFSQNRTHFPSWNKENIIAWEHQYGHPEVTQFKVKELFKLYHTCVKQCLHNKLTSPQNLKAQMGPRKLCFHLDRYIVLMNLSSAGQELAISKFPCVSKWVFMQTFLMKIVLICMKTNL